MNNDTAKPKSEIEEELDTLNSTAFEEHLVFVRQLEKQGYIVLTDEVRNEIAEVLDILAGIRSPSGKRSVIGSTTILGLRLINLDQDIEGCLNIVRAK